MIRSFLMIGQSNMAGRGRLNEVDAISDPRLLMQRNCKWQPLCEPVNYDRPFAGTSLATSFAWHYIQDHPDEEAALIPCADGGTGMDEWAKGGVLYEHAVFCAKQAMRTSTLTAILWHQGEHDSCAELADSYAEKFTTFIAQLQADIGVSVPVIIGQVPLEFFSSDAETRHYSGIVNLQLQSVAKNVPGIYYVSAKGVESNGDELHINAKSLQVFGRRYYEAFSKRASIFDEDIL